MNRKGQFVEAEKTIFWTMIMFFVTLIILIFSFTLIGYKSKLTVVPPELQAELIALRLANVPECFAYQDEVTGRVYSGIIDLNKFNDRQLNRCYRTAERGEFRAFNFRLKLLSNQEQLLTDNYFHLDSDQFTIFKEVLVKDGSHLKKDELIIFVQEGRGKSQIESPPMITAPGSLP